MDPVRRLGFRDRRDQRVLLPDFSVFGEFSGQIRSLNPWQSVESVDAPAPRKPEAGT
jgi:hypothetical protein